MTTPFMRTTRVLIALSGSLVCAAPGFGEPVRCPAQLTVHQTAPNAPAGMRILDIAPDHAWTNVQFSDGPPDHEAWLAPDSSQRHGKEMVNLWRLSQSADGTWVSCTYTGTSLAASFRLPDPVRRCEVRYDETVSPPSATSVDCR